MRSLVKFLPSVVVTLLALFATGCNHKELCYQHPHVGEIRVEFDWRYAPEATVFAAKCPVCLSRLSAKLWSILTAIFKSSVTPALRIWMRSKASAGFVPI